MRLASVQKKIINVNHFKLIRRDLFLFFNDEAGKLKVKKISMKKPMTFQYFGHGVVEPKPWKLLIIYTDGNTLNVIYTCASDFNALCTGGKVNDTY